MGFDFRPAEDVDPSDRVAYFADYARQRKLWLAEKGGFDAVEDDEGVVTLVEREVSKERGFRVIEPFAPITLADLGLSPKRLAVALLAMGWTVSLWRQVGEHGQVLYVHDSDERDANQHSAGDERYPTKVVRRYVVEARFGEHPVAIQAFFEGEGDEGASASFEWCRIRDSAYGIVQIDTLDYTYSKREAEDKGWTEERRIQEGTAMNRRYPAEAHKVDRVYYRAADPMNQWVDFYLDLTSTHNDGKRLTRKKKTPADPAQRERALLRGGDWSG